MTTILRVTLFGGLGVLGVLLVVGAGRTGAQDMLPTPRGQLGVPNPGAPAGVPLDDLLVTETPEDDGCEVAPRSPESLLALAGTPTAGGERGVPGQVRAPDGLTDGEPADTETVAEIRRTTREVRACLRAGEPLRSLALFSDEFVREFAGAGSAEEVLAAVYELATPRSAGDVPNFRDRDLRVLGDGRVGAPMPPPDGMEASAGPGGEAPSFVVFVEHGDRWVIDQVHSVEVSSTTAVATFDGGAVPSEVEGVVRDAAGRLGVAPGAVAVVRVEPRDWSDSSLGCPREGEFYAQVITPGYLIVVEGNGEELEYHTDEAGNFVFCEGR